MFEKGPRTRNMSGACTPVSTRNFNALGRYLAHHTLAALTQNSCRCEYLRPGNKLSSSLRRRIHLSEKETMFVLLLCKHMIWYILVPSMWFWSVSWSTNCPVYFSFFFGRPKKKLSSIRSFLFTLLNFLSSLFWKCGFGQSLGQPIVQSISHFLKKTEQKIQESEQERSETGQFFFCLPKKREIDLTIGWPRDWPKPHGRDFSEKMLISNRCISGLMSNLMKKSWTVSSY